MNKSTIAVVGCGGVGGYLLKMLKRSPLEAIRKVLLIDGDVFTETNVERQEYAEPGQYKVRVLEKVLTGTYQVQAFPEFLNPGALESPKADIIVCLVDNNRGREAAVDMALANRAPMLICTNETTSYQAVFIPRGAKGVSHLSQWYPEWFEPDPEIANVSCSNPLAPTQTAVANLGAALMGYQLLRAFLPYLRNDQGIRTETPWPRLSAPVIVEESTENINSRLYHLPIGFNGSRFNMKGQYLCNGS